MIVNIAVINYPSSLQSAAFGLLEMFEMANQVCIDQQLQYRFNALAVNLAQSLALSSEKKQLIQQQPFDVVLLPPSNDEAFYLSPDINLIKWLRLKHSDGAIIGSACAGAFILAAAGLLTTKQATTHWGLEDTFRVYYPDIALNIDKILINKGDVITAGGIMSWIDLGLEVVAQFSQVSVMRQLGKLLVIDTGLREQRYYQQFTPIFNHGDEVILNIQKKLQGIYTQNVSIVALAKASCLTERTFLRRFVKATTLRPYQYIQRLRVQRACELLETTSNTFEWVANKVGYENASACRKLFINVMGLTPTEFKKRFVSS